MTLSRLTKRVEALGSAWEQFKQVNDRRIDEIERKGNADPLTIEQLNKINGALDGYKNRLEHMETAMVRPGLGGVAAQGGYSASASEHKEAFCSYLRKGTEDDLAFLEKKALSVGSDPDGGYLVTQQMSGSIVEKVYETSPMRQLASVESISSDALEVLEETTEAVAGWSASETAAVADTDTPDFVKKVIAVHELFAQPKATQKLLDDASVDVEAWLSEKLVDVFSRKENAAFINGTGTGHPKGILTYPAGTSATQIEQVNSGSAGNVTADSLIQLYYALKEEYAAHATFLMNRATVQQARLLKESTTDQYLWNPGLSAGAPDTLLGVPVMQAADMPAPTASSLSVALGDFSRAYQIVDRTGLRVLRDPYTEKPFVKFYSTKRVGGDVINTEAIKLLNLAV